MIENMEFTILMLRISMGLIVALFRGHSRSIRGEVITTGGDNE